MKKTVLLVSALALFTGCATPQRPRPIGDPSPTSKATVLEGTWVVDIPRTIEAQTQFGLDLKQDDLFTIQNLKLIRHDFRGDRWRAFGPHNERGSPGEFSVFEQTDSEIVIRAMPDYEKQAKSLTFDEIKERSRVLGPIRFHLGFRFLSPDLVEAFSLYPWRDGVKKKDWNMYFKRISRTVKD